MSYKCRLFFCLFISGNFAFCTAFYSGNKHYGEPCIGSCGGMSGMDCQDGICQCKTHYSSSISQTKMICKRDYTSFCRGQFSCSADKVCEKNHCICRAEKMSYLGKCIEVPFLNPMDKCSVQNDDIKLCDYNKFSFCQNSRCMCFGNYYYNSSLSECRLKKESAAYSLSGQNGYKAKPGGYCMENSDCIDGLNCGNAKCSCPGSCKYMEKEEICDCGKVELETPHAVIWVGCIFGFISVLLWGCLIRKTYRKRMEKSEAIEATTEEEDGGMIAPEFPLGQGYLYNEMDSSQNDKPPPYPSSPCFSPDDKPPPYSSSLGFSPNNQLPYPTNPNYSPWKASSDNPEVLSQPPYQPPGPGGITPYTTGTPDPTLPIQSEENGSLVAAPNSVTPYPVSPAAVPSSLNALNPFSTAVQDPLSPVTVPLSSQDAPTYQDPRPPLNSGPVAPTEFTHHTATPSAPIGDASSFGPSPTTINQTPVGPYPLSQTQTPVGPYPLSQTQTPVGPYPLSSTQTPAVPYPDSGTSSAFPPFNPTAPSN